MKLLKNIARYILGITRGIILALCASITVLTLTIVNILRPKDLLLRMKIRQSFCRISEPILGIRKRIIGTIPTEGTFLYVCNHRSSLDPLFILTDIIASPIAKYEVKSWPVVGYGTTLSGVLYVNKGDKNSRGNTKREIYSHLTESKNVMLFPEGRTHGEELTITYRRGSFEQAALAGIPIVPIAIEFKDQNDYWRHKYNFAHHFIRSFGSPTSHISLSYGEPFYDKDPIKMLAYSQQFAHQMIIKMREDYGTHYNRKT